MSFHSRRRSTPVSERVVVSETVEIARPPAEVMEFLLDPASGVTIGLTVTRAFRAPDTPAGQVGEQHFYVSEADGVVVVDVEQVEEIDFPHRVRTRNLTVPGDLQVVYACEPLGDDATTYTQEASITIEDPRERAITEGLFRQETVRSVLRIKEVLEDG